MWGTSPQALKADPVRLLHTKPFTCLAMDAAASLVAAGDASGRILVWHDVAAGRADACTTVHWHAQAVRGGPRMGCFVFVSKLVGVDLILGWTVSVGSSGKCVCARRHTQGLALPDRMFGNSILYTCF